MNGVAMPLLWTGLTVLGAILFLVAVFRPLEVLFPARAAQPFFRPSWRLDLSFFLGQYLLVSLMAPSFAAGAITGEKERESYEMLLASPLEIWSWTQLQLNRVVRWNTCGSTTRPIRSKRNVPF